MLFVAQTNRKNSSTLSGGGVFFLLVKNSTDLAEVSESKKRKRSIVQYWTHPLSISCILARKLLNVNNLLVFCNEQYPVNRHALGAQSSATFSSY